MSMRKTLIAAFAGMLVSGGGAMADDPISTPDGRTITQTAVSAADQVEYPTGCPVVYETFNDSFPPDFGNGWTISDGFVGCWGPAHKFVADDDFALCQILVSATHVTGSNQYLVRLHADDAGGQIPGSEMGAWEFFDIPQNQGGPTPLLVGDATGISLVAGDSYWLSIVASSGAGDSWGVLRMSTLPGNERPNATWACSQWNNRGVLNSGAWRVTGQVGGGGVTLGLTGACPGTVTVSWAGATPDRPMGVVFAASTGSFVIPGGPCGGTTLGLSSAGLRLVRTLNTGPRGSGQVNGNAGTGACGRFLQLVVFDNNPCTTSNVAQFP